MTAFQKPCRGRKMDSMKFRGKLTRSGSTRVATRLIVAGTWEGKMLALGSKGAGKIKVKDNPYPSD